VAHLRGILPRARCATRLSGRRLVDDGHGAFIADGADRHMGDGAGKTTAAAMTSPLGEKIAAIIRTDGPLTIADYTSLCLLDPDHGYYTTRNPFGSQGD